MVDRAIVVRDYARCSIPNRYPVSDRRVSLRYSEGRGEEESSAAWVWRLRKGGPSPKSPPARAKSSSIRRRHESFAHSSAASFGRPKVCNGDRDRKEGAETGLTYRALDLA